MMAFRSKVNQADQSRGKPFARRERKWLLALLFAPALTLTLWWWQQTPKQQPLLCFEAGPKAIPTSVAYSRDGKYIACAFAVEKGYRVTDSYGSLKVWRSGEVRIYNARDGKLKTTLFSGGEVSNIAFTSDGKYLRAAENNALRWWNLRNGLVARRVKTASVVLVFSSDEQYFVEALIWPRRDDQTLVLCEARGGRVQRVLGKSLRGFYSAQFFPDGKHLLTLSDESQSGDMELRVYATRGAGKFQCVTRDNFMVWITRLRDGRIVVGNRSPFILQNGRRVPLPFGEFNFDPRFATASRDDRLLIACGFDIRAPRWGHWLDLDYSSEEDPDAWHGRAAVWDMKTGKMLRHIEAGKEINDAVISPDNERVAAIVADSCWSDSTKRGHVEVWPTAPS